MDQIPIRYFKEKSSKYMIIEGVMFGNSSEYYWKLSDFEARHLRNGDIIVVDSTKGVSLAKVTGKYTAEEFQCEEDPNFKSVLGSLGIREEN